MSLPASNDRSQSVQFELRFEDLHHVGRAYAFPCDAEGNVNIDSLSDRGRVNYLFARAVVGQSLAWPVTSAASNFSTEVLSAPDAST